MEQSLNILIVEDEVITIKHLELGLQKRGYSSIQTATRGEKAIELARKENPDIVIMDYSLIGKLNGLETAEVIVSFCSPHFIFISGYHDIELKSNKENHISGTFLTKPYNLLDIIHIIDEKKIEKLKRSPGV